MKKIRSSRRKSLRRKSMRKSRRKSVRRKSMRKSRRKSVRRKSVRKSLRKRSRRRSRRRSSKRKSIKRKGFKPPVKGWYIITREGCPYCKDAKNLLDSKGQKYKSVNITVSNRERIYRDVDTLTKTYRYVPMVFKDGKFIGGFSELKSYI